MKPKPSLKHVFRLKMINNLARDEMLCYVNQGNVFFTIHWRKLEEKL